MNDEIKGKVENLKGRAKQAVGTVSGDKELEAEGAAERGKGAIQEMAGKAKRKLEDAADSVKDALGKDRDTRDEDDLPPPDRQGNA